MHEREWDLRAATEGRGLSIMFSLLIGFRVPGIYCTDVTHYYSFMVFIFIHLHYKNWGQGEFVFLKKSKAVKGM